MTQIASNYAKVLYELGISETVIAEGKEIWEKSEELRKVMKSPIVQKTEKHRVVERIFPQELQNFLKVLCDYESVGALDEIFACYEAYALEQRQILMATLIYVEKPSEEQLGQMETFLCQKYGAKGVQWKLCQDAGLLGGFVLRVKDFEYDWSLRGRMHQLKMIWR